MAKPRSIKYKQGDKIVVYIPKNASEDILNYINYPKYISPVIIGLIEEKVNEKKEQIKI